ncbi:hypothetical protein E8E14_008009 [Neopestalotiopsis sp. 37M]|nr:hypothetical protein E8E14_008009 [Neopestalotiopsis sp. 37M]
MPHSCLPLLTDYILALRAFPRPRAPLGNIGASRSALSLRAWSTSRSSMIRCQAARHLSSYHHLGISQRAPPPSAAPNALGSKIRMPLLHQGVIAGNSVAELEQLVRSGDGDVNQPDSKGRLALHALCGAGYYEAELPVYLMEQSRWLIPRTADVDARDRDGASALHLASMMSEYLVKELLAAGADPAGTTLEGLAPLHLAARARQSNVIGMLLSAMAGRSDKVNAQDQHGRTPLHYACRSGRFESVSLLLAAGADPTAQDVNDRTPLDACTEFEEEQALWSDYGKPDFFESQDLIKTTIPDDWCANAVDGVKLNDPLRPWVAPGRVLRQYLKQTYGDPVPAKRFGIRSVQDTAGLHDVLPLLLGSLLKRGENVPDLKHRIEEGIRLSESKRMTYTAKSFRHLLSHGAFNGSSTAPPEENSAMELIQRCQDDLQEAYGSLSHQRRDYVSLTVVEYLLRQRETQLLHRIFRYDDHLPPLREEDVGNIARLLARHGFASLMETLISSRYGPKIADDISGPSTSVDPILVVACHRELPNMDAIRLLVEQGGVDVNAQSRTGEEAFADIDRPGEVYEDDVVQAGMNTALHELAKGFYWWQVDQGIPYLVLSGADLGQRNEDGQTPLELAQNMPEETFTKEAASALEAPSNT